MDQNQIIILSSFGSALLLLLILVIVLVAQVSSLRRRLNEIVNASRVRVQKLKMDNDKNHAFHNPTISPDEELSRRGFSMYVADDLESQRGTERQTGGQLVEELTRELDNRQHRQQKQQYMPQQQKQKSQQKYQPPEQHYEPPEQQYQQPPSFLLKSIEENKRRSRLANPVANNNNNTRQSDTNPNFIYY